MACVVIVTAVAVGYFSRNKFCALVEWFTKLHHYIGYHGGVVSGSYIGGILPVAMPAGGGELEVAHILRVGCYRPYNNADA